MSNSNNIQTAFGKDDESLAIFLRRVKKFNDYFCELMADGIDFTLRIEVHGNKGRMIHCRVYNDGFERPRDVSTPNETKRIRKSNY